MTCSLSTRHLRVTETSGASPPGHRRRLSPALFCCRPSDPSDAVRLTMLRSRRLLFVLSPEFLVEKSFSLLECRLGLYLQHSCQASIIAVTYCSISKLPYVEVAQIRRAATTTVTWRGSQSDRRRSRFWLRMRLALPIRPLALGQRLIDSSSSHSDLAALALQRTQPLQNQNHGRANQSHRATRAVAGQLRGDRRTTPTEAGRAKRWGTGAWPQPGGSCSGCTGFIGRVEELGVELEDETRTQQIRSDPVPETDPTPNIDSTHNSASVPVLDSDRNSDSLPPPHPPSCQ